MSQAGDDLSVYHMGIRSGGVYEMHLQTLDCFNLFVPFGPHGETSVLRLVYVAFFSPGSEFELVSADDHRLTASSLRDGNGIERFAGGSQPDLAREINLLQGAGCLVWRIWARKV